MADRPWVNFRRMSIRLPWWMVLSVLIPLTLYRVARFVVRNHRTVRVVVVLFVLYDLYRHVGWLPLLLAALAVGVAIGLWAWRAPSSCRRFLLLPLIGRWRRLWVYRRQWAEALALSNLHKTFEGTVLLPQRVGVRCKASTDEVTVRMLRGQNPELYHKAAVNLAYSFGTRQCRVFSTRRAAAPFRTGRL